MDRYKMVVWSDGYADIESVEDAQGAWVRYSDAAAEITRLRARVEELERFVAAVRETTPYMLTLNIRDALAALDAAEGDRIDPSVWPKLTTALRNAPRLPEDEDDADLDADLDAAREGE